MSDTVVMCRVVVVVFFCSFVFFQGRGVKGNQSAWLLSLHAGYYIWSSGLLGPEGALWRAERHYNNINLSSIKSQHSSSFRSSGNQ